jgi:serine/threonine protein kinase
VKPRVPVAPAISASASSSNNPDSDHDVVVKEKEERINGEGYTIHRYLRGRLLGKGGFAKVFMCTALDTNKQYAVKVVPKANLVKTRARQKVCSVLFCLASRVR